MAWLDVSWGPYRRGLWLQWEVIGSKFGLCFCGMVRKKVVIWRSIWSLGVIGNLVLEADSFLLGSYVAGINCNGNAEYCRLAQEFTGVFAFSAADTVA